MIEDTLRESLATGVGTEISSEAERLVDGQVSLNVEEGSTGALLLREDVTTTAIQHTVDTTHGAIRALDLDQEDGLEETGIREELGGVDDVTASGQDLATTTMDGVSVESDVDEVEAAAAHGLTSEDTLLSGQLEGTNARVLDFVQVLDGLGHVDEDVGTGGLGTEAPDLTGITNVPTVLLGEEAGTSLELVLGAALASLNVHGKLLSEGLSGHVETIVGVGGLGEGGLGALATDGLTVGDNGVTIAERNTGVILLEILQTDLQVQLTGTSNDVLTSALSSEAEDTGIGLGEALETFDELGEIVGVLDINGNLDDRGDGELHDLHVVGSLAGGDGTALDEELIDTDKTNNVTGRAVLNRLGNTTHHEHGTLDVLDEEIVLLAGLVVGALNTDLLASTDGTGEDTTEGVETSLLGGGDHLGDVKHEGSLGVAVLDTDGTLIIHGTLIKSLSTVVLSGEGRGQVDSNHFKEGISSGEETAHDNLEQLLAAELLLLVGELDVKLGKHVVVDLSTLVKDGIEELVDGVEDEHVERTLKWLAIIRGRLGGPLLGGGVEIVVTPEALHHLGTVNTKLLGVLVGKLMDGEGPTVETGTEGNVTKIRGDLAVSEGLVEVGGDDDVDGLDDTEEVGVKGLLVKLELEKGTIDLVDNQDGLDTLSKGLAKHSLSLHRDTFNGVDDDESTISNTESSSDFRGEVNVSGRVDQVDQELVTVSLLLDIGNKLLVQFEVHGDGSGLDGNAALLLIRASVSITSTTFIGNNTGLGDQSISQSRLAVVDVSNDGHVTNIRLLVHHATELINSKVHLRKKLIHDQDGCFIPSLRARRILRGPWPISPV